MTALPPGPADGVLRQTVRLHRDPLGLLREAQRCFGDVFTLRLATAPPLVVVAAPQEVPAILALDRAGEARRRILPIASPRSVFGGDGEQYRAARERIGAAFGPEAVAAHRDALAALAVEHAERWPRGRPFRLLPALRALIDEAFVRRFLGVRAPERVREYVAAIRRMLWTPGNPPLSIPAGGLLGRGATALFERRRAPLAKLLAADVEAARAAPGEDVIGLAARSDVPTPELVDELVPLLMAAQEPPAAGLTWLVDTLLRQDGLGERFLAAPELRDPVVRETLRLRPPAIAALRRLTAPRAVAGHELPAGATVMLPIPLLHRDGRAFPDPDAFRPQRWSEPAGERPYLPFGGGPRRCLGEHLAQLYIDAILPEVLRAARLRPVLPRPERAVLRGTILVPQRSALVRAV